LNEKELLPDQSALDLCQLDKGDHDWSIHAETAMDTAKCPGCDVQSSARHSSYLRHLKDLANTGASSSIDGEGGTLALQKYRL
jgi:transposase